MTRRGRRAADDHGSATVHAATVTILLVVMTLVVLQATALVRMRHRVAAAADLAALAASRTSVEGGDGCARARSVARRNGAELVACRMDFDVATVTASDESPRWWGGRWKVEQRARAAPESYVLGRAAGASASSASSRAIAPALSSGSLPLPHLGE